MAILFFLVGIAFLVVPQSTANLGWCYILASIFLISFLIVVFLNPKEEIKKTLEPMEKSKHKYTVSSHFVDNVTGKTADIFMSGDDPQKLGSSLGKFIEASCTLVNLSEAELHEVSVSIQNNLKEKTK